MLLPKNKQHKTGERSHTIDRPMQLGKVSVRFVMTGILGALALLYLAQSTQSAARSYEVRALVEQKRQLEAQKDQLEINSIQLRSLTEIGKVVPMPTPAPTTSSGSPTPSPTESAAWEPIREIAYPVTAEPVAQRP